MAQWLWQSGLIEEDVVHEAQQLALINGVLDLEHQRQLDPGLASEIMEALAQ